MEFAKQPKTHAELAEERKQAKVMLTVAGVLIALTIVWVLAGGSAPKLFILGIGIFGALGLIKRSRVKKAEAALGPEPAAPAQAAAPAAAPADTTNPPQQS